ncbi:21844_t:CDS:1 [Cetraspora pellucida]|uniref:21844_t:CDS:1 n=1 Tax=Cetraspora pellucida TaxID=1433469 RepID=A0A9N8ZFQ4_9GLOM|nr:21844_t:CDS:1 [Cetraspora pellucida]
MRNSEKKNYYNIAREDLEKLSGDISVEEDIKLSKTQRKIKVILRKLKRARKLNRIHTLVYAFYLGEILEKAWEKNTYKYNKDLSRYYAEVSVRVYYLFKKAGVKRIYQTTKLTLATISKLKAGEFQQLVNDNDNNDDSEEESSSQDNNDAEELSQNDDTENKSFQNIGLPQTSTSPSQETPQQVNPVLITIDRHNDYQLSFHPNIVYQSFQGYSGFSGAHATIGSQLQNGLEFSNITDGSQAYTAVGQSTQIATNTNTFQNMTVPHFHGSSL